MEKGVTTAAGQGLNDKCEVGLYNCENVSLLLFSAPRSKQSFYNIRKEDLVSKLGCMRRICHIIEQLTTRLNNQCQNLA